MRKIILLILFVLCVSIAYATSLPWTYKAEIKQQAEELSQATVEETVQAIDYWVESNISYVFYYKPRSAYKIWISREGDCTDKALLKKAMLDHLNIKSRFVHGYADKTKHDWLEYYYNRSWYTNEDKYYGLLQRLGLGYW